MGSFVISYVPEVEHVTDIDHLGRVDTVKQVEKALQLDHIDLMDRLKQVDHMDLLDLVDVVNTVKDVRKLPWPYFPLKQFNYQPGGMLHVTPTQNAYQAVYVPECDVEFKGLQLSFTSYNIEDTYDVMVGARYVIRGSHVKEMCEFRQLEVYELVPAHTPIVVHFHNNSGLEKYLMWDFACLIDQQQMAYPSVLHWNFTWEGLPITVNEQDICTVYINQPNYVNLDSSIASFELDIIDVMADLQQATVIGNSGGVSSNYVETDPKYQGAGFLGRVNVMAIIAIRKHQKSIEVVFKNTSTGGSLNEHPIEMRIVGRVVNSVVNG